VPIANEDRGSSDQGSAPQCSVQRRLGTELMAAPGRSESFLDSFFRETGISIDWALHESVWRTAGRAFQGYAARRRKQRDAGPRRILADFLIGAHALEGGHSLLTLDDHLYRTAFPRLAVVRV